MPESFYRLLNVSNNLESAVLKISILVLRNFSDEGIPLVLHVLDFYYAIDRTLRCLLSSLVCWLSFIHNSVSVVLRPTCHRV